MSGLALAQKVFSLNVMDLERLKTDLAYITQREALPEGESLAQVLGRLDAFAQENTLPERLEHYLRKRSYVKAIEWIENPETPHYQ